LRLECSRADAARNYISRNFNGFNDSRITRAAADIAAKALLALLDISIGLFAQCRRASTYHSRTTVAARDGAGLVKCPLNGGELTRRREPLDCFDFRAICLRHGHQARFHELAIDENGAGAAFAGTTTFPRSGQVEVVSQKVDQPLIRLGEPTHLA